MRHKDHQYSMLHNKYLSMIRKKKYKIIAIIVLHKIFLTLVCWNHFLAFTGHLHFLFLQNISKFSLPTENFDVCKTQVHCWKKSYSWKSSTSLEAIRVPFRNDIVQVEQLVSVFPLNYQSRRYICWQRKFLTY